MSAVSSEQSARTSATGGRQFAMTDQEMLDSLLHSTECPGCGRTKLLRQTFCKRCYRALSPEMRRDLYKLFADGYQEAVHVALNYLRQPGEPVSF